MVLPGVVYSLRLMVCGHAVSYAHVRDSGDARPARDEPSEEQAARIPTNAGTP